MQIRAENPEIWETDDGNLSYIREDGGHVILKGKDNQIEITITDLRRRKTWGFRGFAAGVITMLAIEFALKILL